MCLVDFLKEKGRIMLNYLKQTTAGLARTENGALAHASTGSKVLNLFALGGAVRQRSEQEVRDLIHEAWNDDKSLAIRAIFFLADVREGQGERDFFKNALNYLIQHSPEVAARIIPLIPEYSRWDLVYQFVATKLEADMFSYVKEQFQKDLKTETPSLLGKWLKSVNTSSEESNKLGRLTAKKLGLTEKEYRKSLSTLRERIGVVEKAMSAQNWDKVDFNKMPGMAYSRYMNAWKTHIPTKLEKYLDAVTKGELAMKTGVLYPHNVMKDALLAHNSSDRVKTQSTELQWKGLPDYVDGDMEYIMPVIDTSASMRTPIDSSGTSAELVARSLGIYLSERLAGPFKNHFITFSSRPVLAELKGETIARRYINMPSIVENTNIEAVFDLILNTAVTNRLTAEDMPSKIVIFSDMEFDSAATSRVDLTLFNAIERKFVAAGYALPQLIFWNLSARNDQHPVNQHKSGAALVSGYSPVTFKYMLGKPITSPYENMLEVLNSPRYAGLVEVLK
jgi:hypothetical protein